MSQSHLHTGLSTEEVEKSRALYGCNTLTPPQKTPTWKLFLEKFSDPLIIILLVAGLCSFGIACYEYFGLDKSHTAFLEPMGIFIAILLATSLAFYFERQADKEFTLLNQVNDEDPIRVVRNGNTLEVPKRDIVVGDIVLLDTGNEIPADGELLEAISLNVDESTLTGEPICHKSTFAEDFDPEATFSTNHVMRGTKVMEGHGIFRVLAVGDQTENGKVFEAAQIDDSVKTPLNEQLDGLGALITKISYAFAALILVGRTIIYFTGHSGVFDGIHFLTNLLDTIMIAVTLIVVAVPEGLPMAVTLSLAYSMRRMLKTNNLVRKMHACETMGATTVICTDKTGTLTQNQMRVSETRFFGLNDQRLDNSTAADLVSEGIAANSTATLDLSNRQQPFALGNPTEGALLLWLHNQDIDYRDLRAAVNILGEVPFSTEHKYMAVLVESAKMPGKQILYVKGAPEIVFELCGKSPISKNDLNNQLFVYQSKAMRTLGFACKVLESDENVLIDGKLATNDLQFLGFVAITDPVRSDVPAAVGECIAAGINIKIVTGDTPATAREIGRQIGLWDNGTTDDAIITGPEFETLSDNALLERIEKLKIIARARPMDKKRLVETLQKINHVVAVTGDGTNDAPALKAAHVGLSMGDGTSVAKEASDITIVDNSFSSIGRAVMWGRSLYQNIQRFILFQMTVNVAACFIVLAGAFMETASPLTVTQMLWVNLIMDTFAAMALASLPPSEKVMNDHPRNRNAFIIDRNMRWSIIGIGGTFFAILLGLVYLFKHSHITQLTDLYSLQLEAANELSAYELSIFFTIFVMLQFWNMFNARAYHTGRSAFHLTSCRGFLFITLCILVGQVLIVQFGGQMFNVTPLHFADWCIIICTTSVVLWVGELVRLFSKR